MNKSNAIDITKPIGYGVRFQWRGSRRVHEKKYAIRNAPTQESAIISERKALVLAENVRELLTPSCDFISVFPITVRK
jgi:hypothetical protein